MSLADEVRLVSRIVEGDRDALDEFISTYRSLVFSILMRHMNLTRDDADEVFQRFLIHIWEDDYRRLRTWSRKAPLSAFLGRMVRNLAGDFRREQQREARGAYADRTPLDAGYLGADSRRIVEAALAELSPRDRELIHRRYFMGQTYQEIARALGITVNHAGVALSRALFRLKQILIRKNL